LMRRSALSDQAHADQWLAKSSSSPRHQGSQSIQAKSKVPFRLVRIKLPKSCSNGTIYIKVVAHGYTCSFLAENHSVTGLATFIYERVQ